MIQSLSLRSLTPVTAMSVIFQRTAILNTPGALSHTLTGTSTSAKIVTTFPNRVEITEVTRYGSQLLSSEDTGPSDNAKPILTTTDKHHCPPEIPGLVKVHAVPGFEESSISVAELKDGTHRSFVRDKSGKLQITGIIPQWPHIPPVSGPWAISSTTGNRVVVFAVTANSQASPSCSCCGISSRRDLYT